MTYHGIGKGLLHFGEVVTHVGKDLTSSLWQGNIINASLTNFFFFKDKEEKYGPKEKHISCFKFFDVSSEVHNEDTSCSHEVYPV